MSCDSGNVRSSVIMCSIVCIRDKIFDNNANWGVSIKIYYPLLLLRAPDYFELYNNVQLVKFQRYKPNIQMFQCQIVIHATRFLIMRS